MFGDKGLVDTLGPTWDMVHDPRFTAIENCFITQRKAVFGGDARTGINRQMADGSFTGSMADLEQYSEILGEGRHFYEVLSKGIITPEEDGTGDMLPICIDPRRFYDADKEVIWSVIKKECPNYFDRQGNSNLEAKRLHKLFRADLVGLIADYAEIANVQEWTYLDESGTLVRPEDMDNPEIQRVWMEVECRDKALTFRAQLRCTAARILNHMGLTRQIETMGLTRIMPRTGS